jgi:excisionase family DNA binding protein
VTRRDFTPTSGGCRTDGVSIPATFDLPYPVVEQIAEVAAEIVLVRLREMETARPQYEYLTIPEAAALLRCGRQRIDNLLSSGRLTRVKEGRRTLVARGEIEEYLVRFPKRDRR